MSLKPVIPPGDSICSFTLAIVFAIVFFCCSILSKLTPILNGVEAAAKKKKLMKLEQQSVYPSIFHQEQKFLGLFYPHGLKIDQGQNQPRKLSAIGLLKQ